MAAKIRKPGILRGRGFKFNQPGPEALWSIKFRIISRFGNLGEEMPLSIANPVNCRGHHAGWFACIVDLRM
jgi:hypothetical protein